MRDKTITCIQCDSVFIFSVSEQKMFQAKGFDDPARCPECRKKKVKKESSSREKKRHDGKRKTRHQDYEDEWD